MVANFVETVAPIFGWLLACFVWLLARLHLLPTAKFELYESSSISNHILAACCLRSSMETLVNVPPLDVLDLFF